MNDNIFLSFCIPTYNRAEVVYRTVTSILKCERDDIEVVVSNNDSPDNTEELLSSIKDSRLKLFKNEYNNGGDNLISVLTYATGKYLLLLSDEDRVILRNVDYYIDILKRKAPAVALGTTVIDRKKYGRVSMVEPQSGMEALKNYRAGFCYMSGYIYNRKIMQKVSDQIYGTEINKKFGYGYNFTNLARRMMEYGDFITIPKMISIQVEEGRRDMGTHFDKGIYYASPEYQIFNFEDAIHMFKDMKIGMKDKYLLTEIYRDDYLIGRSISDYDETHDALYQREIKRKGYERIEEYYKSNVTRNKGIGFILRLYKNYKKTNKMIKNAKIFPIVYRAVQILFIKDTCKILKERYLKLIGFSIEKYVDEK